MVDKYFSKRSSNLIKKCHSAVTQSLERLLTWILDATARSHNLPLLMVSNTPSESIFEKLLSGCSGCYGEKVG